jgi:gelsolin
MEHSFYAVFTRINSRNENHSKMLKASTIPLEESNIAHLGGKEEHNARKKAAMGEEAFKTAGSTAGLEIWRIEDMEVISWPKSKYGNFFSGDSYIVLNTKVDKDTGKKSYDVHSWQGLETSIDERTVSAYKMVELDDILGDVPVQHRDVQSHESKLFTSYFKVLTIMDGGVATGFNHMEPESYVSRLLHFKGKGKNVSAKQIPMEASSMNHGDVFLLDAGLTIFQWNGVSSGGFERNKASNLVNSLKSDRPKTKLEVIDGDDDNVAFWDLIEGTIADVKTAEEGGDDAEARKIVLRMFKISDASGELKFDKIAEDDDIDISLLDPKDVFIVDNGLTVFVWVGKEASNNEKKNALPLAEKYIAAEGRPGGTPITRVVDGAVLPEEFEDVFKGE